MKKRIIKRSEGVLWTIKIFKYHEGEEDPSTFLSSEQAPITKF